MIAVARPWHQGDLMAAQDRNPAVASPKPLVVEESQSAAASPVRRKLTVGHPS